VFRTISVVVVVVVVVCVVADGGPPCLRHSPGCLSSRSAVSLLPTRPFPPASRTYLNPLARIDGFTRVRYGATSVRGGWMSRMVKTGVTFVHNEIQQLQTSISSSYSTHPTLHQADHCQSWWGERSSSCKTNSVGYSCVILRCFLQLAKCGAVAPALWPHAYSARARAPP
jgi:hypothetical protein